MNYSEECKHSTGPSPSFPPNGQRLPDIASALPFMSMCTKENGNVTLSIHKETIGEDKRHNGK